MTMSIRGRKPKPTAIKLLNGNPGKRPMNANEPKPKPSIPKCPKWIEPEAKKEWRRIVKELEKLGLLTNLDAAMLIAYCQSYARWKEAEDFITQHGSILKTQSGYIQQVPQVSIAQTYLKIMKDLCSEFGLTPSSRSRMSIPNQREDDEFEVFLMSKPNY